MANRDKLSWLSKSTSSSDLHLQIHGIPFVIDKELLAEKSAKVAKLLKQNSDESLFELFRDMPADTATLELVARFCHGDDPNLSAENIIPVTCIAFYLEMSDTHCKENLLTRALVFFRHIVLPNWDKTLKAFHSMASNFKSAKVFGLFEACLESLVANARANPRLLGEPVRKSAYIKYSDEEENYMPNARRRLFVLDWKSEEDATTLPLQLYEPFMYEMNQHDVPPENVAASLCQYMKKWVFAGDNTSMFKRNSQRDVTEAVERLLPLDRGLLPSTLLFKMLSYAIFLECSSDCINGFESRIGKQLDQATVKDLLILSEGRPKENRYDRESLKSILKHFYGSYSRSDNTGIFSVAELVEEYLIEVASDIDLKTDTFVSLADMSNSTSLGIRNADGIYRAIDIYLDGHNYLTDLEREEVCRVLDCRKMSPEASEHAAKNERLPLRFVVQVLFMQQVQLQNMIPREVQSFADKLRIEEENDATLSSDDEMMRNEMEKMSIKVIELEKECNKMKKEIVNGCSSNSDEVRKGKSSIWKEMKRKLGCINTTIPDCNCQVKKKKKVHPKH